MPNITFDDFRELAIRPDLAAHERIDDTRDLRTAKTDDIFIDILGKLPALADAGHTVVDIGPGCGPVSHALVAHCRTRNHRLWLADSPENLTQKGVASRPIA